MTNLKLIAIRPLQGCAIQYRKVLKLKKVYQFYKQYDFTNYSDRNRHMVVLKNQIPDLYSFEKSDNSLLNINVSAIVGENGSGKSSLTDLLYMACFNISAFYRILYDEDKKRYLTSKDAIIGLRVECFYQLEDNDIRMVRVAGKEIQWYTYNSGIKCFELITTKLELDPNHFFYTIAINYSMHGLNSSIIGNWVNKIFHKNDGYQTPIVLNPYREDGNIDVKKEEDLITYRLISNILGKLKKGQNPEDSLRNVINGKIANKLHVSINNEKFKDDGDIKGEFYFTTHFGQIVLPLVYKILMGKSNFEPPQTRLNGYAKEYIIRKLVSISKKYSPYKENFIGFYTNKTQTAKYLKSLKKEHSHVTIKLTQALNFLTNPLYFNREEKFELTIAYLSRELDKVSKSDTKELIDIIPPAFFKMDIEFKDSGFFSDLSSGEKQRVYSIATLIYHCVNINSTNALSVKYKYKNLNLIFDELELYFHPDLQRTLISDILVNLKRTNLWNIETINLLFITHSPFILSDIPSENILILQKDGIPLDGGLKTETFGANIFDLLKHNFFLANGPIGALAQEKISETIKWLRDDKRKQSQKETHRQLINVIGEPVLQLKLAQMFDEVTEDRSEEALITKRMDELSDTLKQIKNRKK